MSKPLPRPSPNWAYFLDVDGTLIELAETPTDIDVDQGLLDLIGVVHLRSGGALALISGRSLADLDQRLGQTGLPMAGLHGLERRDQFGHLHRHEISPNHIRRIADHLAALTERHPGLILEDKGPTLAIHYRRVPRLGSYVDRFLRQMVDPEHDGLQLQPGKKVLEIKPAGINKGTAIAEFMIHPPFMGRIPVFIGDDLTDEHGFEVVNTLGGFAVKVGRGRTRAKYRLKDVNAVRTWLRNLPSLKGISL
ncbi:Trehalose-phosphate phosphatase [Georgfuchsia toluolica]|uniref:Trehalose 6-phosphate phosphatase n=1 Tax=Georgfuchsia toluolica TaxID=424218 RepID=A0A916J7B7_9PROT|nr:trehalose-phosphatase [Georgfuchsia toluolica]CAG4883746.1 Trehalose-phosphate phosphatase [Georgfuchsia toluolica]